jgi:hypothetical protein
MPYAHASSLSLPMKIQKKNPCPKHHAAIPTEPMTAMMMASQP